MSPRGLEAESWDELFNFLDPKRKHDTGPDRDSDAAARCAEIMRKLVFFFASRRCANPEDLATETVLRVASRCRDVDVSSYSDRIGYFYGVARNVVHEVHRSGQREARARDSFIQEFINLAPPDPGAWEQAEAVHACFEQCLRELPEPSRLLILRYYTSEGSAKIASHRTLATELGKSVNALRIEAHRIRKTLQECVFTCLGRDDAAGGRNARHPAH
jgi:RNA polymerase sigma factor (sigma-70 family)